MQQDTGEGTAHGDLILSNAGQPFKTENAAKAALKGKQLSDQDYHVMAHPKGGYAIAKREQAPTALASPPPAAPSSTSTSSGTVPPPAPPTASATASPTHRWVRFHEKSDPNANDDVELGFQGDVVQAERGKWVVVPVTHLHVADDAIQDDWDIRPQQDRQILARTKAYPYDRGPFVTAEDYEAFKRGELPEPASL